MPPLQLFARCLFPAASLTLRFLFCSCLDSDEVWRNAAQAHHDLPELRPGSLQAHEVSGLAAAAAPRRLSILLLRREGGEESFPLGCRVIFGREKKTPRSAEQGEQSVFLSALSCLLVLLRAFRRVFSHSSPRCISECLHNLDTLPAGAAVILPGNDGQRLILLRGFFSLLVMLNCLLIKRLSESRNLSHFDILILSRTLICTLEQEPVVDYREVGFIPFIFSTSTQQLTCWSLKNPVPRYSF